MLISDWMNKSELNSTVIWQDKFLKNWSYLYQDTSSFSRSHSLHGPSVLIPSSAETESVILLRSGSGSGQGISWQGHDPAAELHRLQTGRGLKCSVCRYFKFHFLAAKAQLNNCTCAVSVHPFVWKLNVFLFGPLSLLSCAHDSLLMTADDSLPMTACLWKLMISAYQWQLIWQLATSSWGSKLLVVEVDELMR